MRISRLALLQLSVLFACKSPNAIDSQVRDIGYAQISDGRYSEIFLLDGADVVMKTCHYPRGVRREGDLGHKAACRYNETRIPWTSLQKEIGAQVASITGDQGANNYRQYVTNRIREIHASRNGYEAELIEVASELAQAADEDQKAQLQQQSDLLNGHLTKTQLELDYYEVALSLVDNIVSTGNIDQSKVMAEIAEKLSEDYIYGMNQRADVLLPVRFSYQIWEGPQAGKERAMKNALQASYAQATELERQKIALAFVAGPAFRNAWMNVYSRLQANGNSLNQTALKRLRQDPDRRITANGKVFAFAAEFYDRLGDQDVSRSIADGLSSSNNPMRSDIRGMSCKDRFGGTARTATLDELEDASEQIRGWKYFSFVEDLYFWAPLTYEGAKLGWGARGWISWYRNKMKDDHETYQVVFPKKGGVDARKVSLTAGAHMFCVLN